MDYIVIPTLGRIDKQITYQSLPEFLREKTVFVVQHHEFEKMSELYQNVMCLPKSITSISPTREWIFNKFKNYRFFVMDDDLRFHHKDPIIDPSNGEHTGKWNVTYMDKDDWEACIGDCNYMMDHGYVHGGLIPTYAPPQYAAWPWRANQRVSTNVFFDGPNVPDGIEWTRLRFSSDFDAMLQLISAGYANAGCTKYMAYPAATANSGGCDIERTIPIHNEELRKLHEFFPNVTRLREKETLTGPWAGMKKLAITIYCKKAYELWEKGAADVST